VLLVYQVCSANECAALADCRRGVENGLFSLPNKCKATQETPGQPPKLVAWTAAVLWALSLGEGPIWLSSSTTIYTVVIPLPPALKSFHQFPPPSSVKILQCSSSIVTTESEADAMHIPALELALFQHRPLPNNAKVFNSWSLNLCAQGCNIAHSVDRTKLDKHPLFNGIPMDQVTFSQCTPAFIECNTNCQKSYQVQMKY
jgi:hypothetical protein